MIWRGAQPVTPSLVLLVALVAVACGGGAETAAPETLATAESGAAATAPLSPETLFLAADASVTPDGTVIARGDAGWPFGEPWRTNWDVRVVELEEIQFVARRDSIPSLDDPRFDAIAAGGTWLRDDHPVIQLEINGDARAFPLGIMSWHEVANTTIGGVAITVTYCPLCNSAVAFERVLLGEVVEFGVSGLLRNSDLIMWDRTTESLWQQLTGKALVGGMVGARLEPRSAPVVSWGQFKQAFPAGLVLSVETGFPFAYTHGSYAGYDTNGPLPEFFRGEPDDRAKATERVVAIDLNGEQVAYTFEYLRANTVVNAMHGGEALVVVWMPGTVSALDTADFAEARDVGAVGVFRRTLGERLFSFKANPEDPQTFIDRETGSVWDIFGIAVGGPLEGERLSPVVHGAHFWFAWAAFFPDTGLIAPSRR